MIENYSHWWLNNKIFIKDNQRNIKFEVDLKYEIDPQSKKELIYGDIFSIQHQKKLIPFSSLKLSNQKLFRNFEDPEYILVIQDDKIKDNYTVSMPRLNLNFYADQQKEIIFSKEYKDHILSSNQAINTFSDFKNYFIIEPETSFENKSKMKRKILIPHHQI